MEDYNIKTWKHMSHNLNDNPQICTYISGMHMTTYKYAYYKKVGRDQATLLSWLGLDTCRKNNFDTFSSSYFYGFFSLKSLNEYDYFQLKIYP